MLSAVAMANQLQGSEHFSQLDSKCSPEVCHAHVYILQVACHQLLQNVDLMIFNLSLWDTVHTFAIELVFCKCR